MKFLGLKHDTSKLNVENIRFSSSVMFFGINIDYRLSINSHIATLCKKNKLQPKVSLQC